MSKFRPSPPSPALAISCLALFVALAGTAFAAGVIRKNSVHSAQIANGAVRTADLGNGAVTGAKVATGAVGAGKLGAGAVGSGELATGAVSASKLAGAAVGAAALADNAVGSGKLKDGAVGAVDLAEIAQAGQETTVPAGQAGNLAVPCPAGTVVVGGGADGGSFADPMVVSERSGNGWHVETKNSGATPAQLRVFAYCLKAGSN